MEKQLKRIIPTQICGHKLLMDSIEHDQRSVAGVGGGEGQEAKAEAEGRRMVLVEGVLDLNSRDEHAS